MVEYSNGESKCNIPTTATWVNNVSRRMNQYQQKCNNPNTPIWVQNVATDESVAPEVNATIIFTSSNGVQDVAREESVAAKVNSTIPPLQHGLKMLEGTNQ